ncbi:MAG: hypothetical protein LZF86_100269 [Nitrospira sp.]|nr:MAG: hypothetical protein LZF86_100269 [Nitrospira sp.]
MAAPYHSIDRGCGSFSAGGKRCAHELPLSEALFAAEWVKRRLEAFPATMLIEDGLDYTVWHGNGKMRQ